MSNTIPPTLSARLARIASYVPDGARVADIGTDHARLPAHLVAVGRVPSAIAVDVRPGALAQARRTIERFGVADRVAVRLGDGLRALGAGECDCVVVAGLGGPTIARILDTGLRDGAGSASRLVLGPQSAACHVRWWLRRNGWALLDEAFVVDEGIGYPILVAEPGDGRSAYRMRTLGDRSGLPASMLLHLGPHLALAATPGWCAYWRAEADALEALAERTARAGTPGARRAAARMVRRAARMRAAVAAALRPPTESESFLPPELGVGKAGEAGQGGGPPWAMRSSMG